MKTPILWLAALAGCIDPSTPLDLADTDQAVDLGARDRMFYLASGAVYSKVQAAPGSTTFAAPEYLGTVGAGLTKLATERNQDGRLSVFAIGPDPDRTLYARYQTAVGGGWNPEGWQSMGGGWIKQVVTARNQDGRIELFVLNDAGQAFHRYQTVANGGWNPEGWLPFSGHDIQTIAATTRWDGRLEVFAAGGDGQLYHRVQYVPNSGWDADWSLIPGTAYGLRDVVTTNDNYNQPMVVAIDANRRVRYIRENGTGNFTAIAPLCDLPMDKVVAGHTHDRRLDILGISGGSVYDCVQQDIYSTQIGPYFNGVGLGSVAQLGYANESGETPMVFARKLDGSMWFGTSRDSIPLPSFTFASLNVSGQDVVAIDQQ